jgi:uncharacterized protein GlcG (DUF336 family)
MDITLEQAKKVIEVAQKKAKELGFPASVAVVDSGGNLVALEKQDGAILASVGISQEKAYSAASTGYTTEQLGGISQPGQSAFGLAHADKGRMTIFEGGVPLMRDGKIIGGVGVSGGSAPQDGDCAEAAAAAIK